MLASQSTWKPEPQKPSTPWVLEIVMTIFEASSGPKTRHRLNTRGNRQLNHALHMAAVTQVRNDTPGRAYYLRKQAEGQSRKEAMRALKRRISDAVYRQLLTDTGR